MREGEPPAAARGARADTSQGAERDGRGILGAPGPGDAPNTLSAARYLVWLYTPASQQHVFALLCEIENEIAGSLRAGIDHQVAHARLKWWGDECERTAQGRAVHPLTRELVKASGDPSRLAGIRGFVDTAVWDLASATFETRKELTGYCERWAVAMFETAAPPRPAADTGGAGGDPSKAAHTSTAVAGTSDKRAAGESAVAAGGGDHRDPSEATPVRVLGTAVRELEMLENLAQEAHAGRLRVPLDELERAGVDAHALPKLPWPAALGTLLGQRHEALRAIIRDSINAFGREEQPGLRGLLVWGALAWHQSMRAQRALPGAIQPRRYDALADGWQAWRAGRRATAGKLRLT